MTDHLLDALAGVILLAFFTPVFVALWKAFGFLVVVVPLMAAALVWSCFRLTDLLDEHTQFRR